MFLTRGEGQSGMDENKRIWRSPGSVGGLIQSVPEAQTFGLPTAWALNIY